MSTQLLKLGLTRDITTDHFLISIARSQKRWNWCLLGRWITGAKLSNAIVKRSPLNYEMRPTIKDNAFDGTKSPEFILLCLPANFMWFAGFQTIFNRFRKTSLDGTYFCLWMRWNRRVRSWELAKTLKVLFLPLNIIT